jgi:excisionase family DNA binding protein
MNDPLRLETISPDEVVEAIAVRVAELVGEPRVDASPWLTIDEAAEYLRLPKQSLYKRRDLPRRMVGSRILFHRGELDAWLDDHAEGLAPRRSVNGSRR